MLNELAWPWQTIAMTLMWKLAPKGLILVPTDLVLPQDRVMLEERTPDRINLTFITLTEAYQRTHAERDEDRASTDRLQGRWQQIATVLLWKLRKAGITLTEQDRGAVPGNIELLTSGHPDGVEWRFIPKLQAAALARSFDEHLGKTIIEK